MDPVSDRRDTALHTSVPLASAFEDDDDEDDFCGFVIIVLTIPGMCVFFKYVILLQLL